ncbi:hypothetical protein A4X13_0g6763 [Tilletia indica]|uniref:DNA 3'-5' helicase n=1 Tax=Tilletia indica TaxID=43049 RepID=A0A177TJQ2_9BASI|nr:hypothetical protein A4X13_0g6763 [Tilletia indica]
MTVPTNNLDFHIRKMNQSVSGSNGGKDERASTGAKFKSASAASSSFQRHSSSGSVQLSHMRGPADRESGSGGRDSASASARRPPIPAPVVPTKRPLMEDPNRFNIPQSAAERYSPPLPEIDKYPVASTSVSSAAPVLLSARASEKRRADDDDVEDYGAAAVMLRYHGPNASVRPGPNSSDMSHPWSKDLYNGLRGTFNLKEFRENQLEAMNATLSGKDVFCLMPTGGGKSLCYQLPALLNSGKTKGVTVVISPLLSLIHDQVQSLMAKDIPALALTGEQTKEIRDFVMSELCQPIPPVKLLYVTPEFVTKSGRAREIFGLLHRRRQLARFVIDEAHCVSQWGHDFRPDYKELGMLRGECPDIPIMAMTATANNRVQTDVLSNLKIEGCVMLKQSFNRSNLEYEVRTKGKDCLSDMAIYIKARAKDECGIIYCLSRAACEDVAAKLSQKYDIEAHHYHAGMPKKDRMSVQRKWQHGEFKVIVATIAFGMGIDKADVRYVIHHTLPSSLEGYYQETGRAGRDGLSSTCILYFAYKDSTSIQRLIQNGEGTWAQKEQRRNNLHQVISYCMNRTDCRRVLVLQYFGEIFPRENCHHSCDNCKGNKTATKTVDVTELAKSAVRLVRDISKSIPGQGATLLHCVEVFRGASKTNIRARGHDECPEFGKGSSLSRGDAERLFQLLLVERILGERSEVNAMGFANAYMQVGRDAKKLLNDQKQLELQIEQASSAAASTAANRRQPQSRVKENPYSNTNAHDDPYDISRLDFDEYGFGDEDVHPSGPTAPEEPPRFQEDFIAPVAVPQNKAAPRRKVNASAGPTIQKVNTSSAGPTLQKVNTSSAGPTLQKVNTSSTGPTLQVADPVLVPKCLDELRKARREIAEANGCSEHVLADDSLLRRLATQLPTNLDQMIAIEGFDEDKANFIGAEMLAICKKHAPSSNQKGAPRLSQEQFLSQFRYQDASSGSGSGSGSSSRLPKKVSNKTTSAKAASSTASSSIRPLGAPRSGRGSGSGPAKRARAF